MARRDHNQPAASECPSPEQHPARNLRIRLASAKAGFQMQMPANRREPAGRRPLDCSPIVGEQEIRSQTVQRQGAGGQAVQYTPLAASQRQHRKVETVGYPRRSLEVVVQGDDRVTESFTKMIYYANHAQWYAANPEAREDVQDVLA
jgi:hypothetical protein